MIDAHLHLWELTPGAYPWLGPQHGPLFRNFGAVEAESVLATAGVGVRGAVLVQADDTVADTEAMLAVADSSDWVLGVVGWIPLEEPARAEAELERLAAHPKFRGVRHLLHNDPRDDFLDLAPVRESLRLLAARGLPFDVPDAFPRHLGAAVRMAREIPGLTVVLDHLGKPPLGDGTGSEPMARWRAEFRALAELPGTAAKLSGLHLPGVPYTAEALRPLWDEALEAFGPERLMIGGDWPVSSLGAPYSETLAVLLELLSELSDAERQQILEGTAVRVYGL
ncbi:amidohydrolase [Arthrobacter sp. SW1]|uniref:amidohydrolase family protein n=1 Tax=Arthrobacter sp. SW1 TaxID=1920889 RepID=UPI000877B199|nr:amidohydrolase family protein [Arthrobacter sp. SW1]OFI38874.1 amidohydrolase [Arthrobacter sp. SW1]